MRSYKWKKDPPEQTGHGEIIENPTLPKCILFLKLNVQLLKLQDAQYSTTDKDKKNDFCGKHKVNFWSVLQV